jgi:K+ transporter
VAVQVAVTAGFNGNSIKLTNAYGLNISMVMTITTFLVSLVSASVGALPVLESL